MKIKSLLIASMILLAPVMAKADNIKIAELNWQSGSMIAEIDSYILQNGYDKETEIVPGGIDATIQSMMSKGTPDIFSEAWISLLGQGAYDQLEQGIRTGKR